MFGLQVTSTQEYHGPSIHNILTHNILFFITYLGTNFYDFETDPLLQWR